MPQLVHFSEQLQVTFLATSENCTNKNIAKRKKNGNAARLITAKSIIVLSDINLFPYRLFKFGLQSAIGKDFFKHVIDRQKGKANAQH
jgi:hypothetical protein